MHLYILLNKIGVNWFFFLNADMMDHALRLLTVKSLLHLHFVIYEFGVEVCVTSLTKHCGCKTVCVHNSDTAI